MPAANGHRRRIRKLRLAALLLLLVLLGLTSFTFGLITAVASQIPTCDPGHVQREVDGHIYANDVPYNKLHDRGYPSIGCHPCTAAVAPGEDARAGRWRGKTKKECGLHVIQPGEGTKTDAA